MTETLEDLGFPWDVFQSIHHLPYSAFLDSSEAGLDADSLSIVAANPSEIFIFKQGRVHILTAKTNSRRDLQGPPIKLFEQWLESHGLGIPAEGQHFKGVAIGFLSYDLLHQFEKVPATNPNPAPVPDICFAFYEGVLLYRHREARWEKHGNADFISAAKNKISMERRVLPEKEAGLLTLPAQRYIEKILKAKQYIRDGEIYQVNLSEQIRLPLSKSSLEVYACLRQISPAAQSAFLRFGKSEILCNSPERFLRAGQHANGACLLETMPIKGTAKRDLDPVKDEAIGKTLLASEKNRAELAMIIDVQRNDLGRISRTGSVNVAQPYILQKLPMLYHLVSKIEGVLKPQARLGDLLRATFPGGSITGAPKIRAMQIIDELEDYTRGVYTGSIGYFGFGRMDLNIAIRTISIQNQVAKFSVGAGIVADSDPDAEYHEILAKGEAMTRALK